MPLSRKDIENMLAYYKKKIFSRKMKKIIINVGAKTENNNIDGIFRPFVSVIDF